MGMYDREGQMKDLKTGILCDLYGVLLTDKQRDMVRDYFDYDLSLSEIAAQHGISRQAVADTVKKCEKTLIDTEKSLGFYAKIAEIKTELEKILELNRSKKYDEATAVAEKLLGRL